MKRTTARGIATFLFILLIIGAAIALSPSGNDYGDVTDTFAGVSAGPSANPSEPAASTSPTPEPEPEYTTATLCVAGDIVLHQPLSDDAYNSATGTYDYTHIFDYARPYFEAADYSVACLETTFNHPKYAYSGYPQFNSPDSLADSLKSVGIDLISTASNHSMDTYVSGLERTLDVLDGAGLAHVGTYRSQDERDENNGIYVADVGGISVAFLAYTYGTNGLSVAGYEYAVNIYTVDYMTNLSVIDYDLISADMAAARALGTDVIAVFMHWGWEYNTRQNSQQDELADFLFNEGADLILGGHTHVPQPMEMWEIDKGDGTTRTGYVAYCLGNFISNQYYDYTNLTAIVNIELTKNERTGEVAITSCEYVPMYMLHPDASNAGRYALLDIHRAMREYESGDKSVISDGVYQKLIKGLRDIHSIMGETEKLR